MLRSIRERGSESNVALPHQGRMRPVAGGAICSFVPVLFYLSLLGGWPTEVAAEVLGGPASQLERAKEFTGQATPYLAVGLRMGEKALKRLGCEKYVGMTIQVECIPKAPYCFLLDGLQLSTGCTMGNRNIEFIPSSRIRVVFTNSRTGEKVAYVLTDGLRAMIEEWSKTWKSDETVALLVYAVPSESLLFRETK